MTSLAEIIQKIADETPSTEPQPAKAMPESCRLCCTTQDVAEGYCSDCRSAINRGYIASAKTGRCANGMQRDSGILYHARMIIDDELPAWKSVCGTKPGRLAFWSERGDRGGEITCPRCLKKLAKIEAQS